MSVGTEGHKPKLPESQIPDLGDEVKSQPDSTPPTDRLVTDVVQRANNPGDCAAEEAFHKLAAEWTEAVGPLSSTTARVQHPAYQQIIALGQAAVPLLLRELTERPNHWFAALRSLTGVNPIPISDRGKIGPTTEAWLRRGKDHGYL